MQNPVEIEKITESLGIIFDQRLGQFDVIQLSIKHCYVSLKSRELAVAFAQEMETLIPKCRSEIPAVGDSELQNWILQSYWVNNQDKLKKAIEIEARYKQQELESCDFKDFEPCLFIDP